MIADCHERPRGRQGRVRGHASSPRGVRRGGTTRGWDGEVIDRAFQHLGVAIERCAAESPVLILPAAIEELTALGIESQETLEADGPEAVSLRLNSLFVSVVGATLANEKSGAAAMATSGIGESGMALLRANSPNGVADHIRRLSSIAIAAIGAGQDHVAGTAHIQFSRLARGLSTLPAHHVMPPSLYHEICTAIADSADAYVGRGFRGLMGDVAWIWVTGPHMQHNLSHAIVAGIRADRHRDRGSDFRHGVTALVQALVKLSADPSGMSLSQSYAAETVYLGVLGAMALDDDERSPELIPELWTTVVRRLLDSKAGEVGHEIEMLASLLVAGVYEAESSGPAARAMREALGAALRSTTAIADDFHRRRRTRAWVEAGRAALGAGDQPLADEIASGTARDVLELRRLVEGNEWRIVEEDWRSPLFTAGQAFYPRPEIPDMHRRPEVVEAFDALLREHDAPPPRRRAARSGGLGKPDG